LQINLVSVAKFTRETRNGKDSFELQTMKTFYLLCVIGILLSSCQASSHVPCMPSEPTFTNALQTQLSAGMSFDHTEAQGAVSVLPFLGFTGNYYWGKKGIKQFEYGINLFTPLNKKKTWFVSLGIGKGRGAYNGSYSTNLFGVDNYTINSKFSSFYIQPSVYRIIELSKHTICKVSFSLKHEEVFFKYMDIAEKNHAASGSSTITTYAQKLNGFAIIHTPFAGFSVEQKSGPFYFQTQLGSRIVTKGFYVTVTHRFANSNPAKSSGQMTKALHPLFSSSMLNMTLGIKLDYFRWKKNKSK
jgi:hypothetical protein